MKMFLVSTLGFLLLVSAGRAADLPLQPKGPIGQPTKPVPFASDTISVTLPLTFTQTPKAEIKSFSGTTPVLAQPMNDPRLPPQYRGQIARNYSQWDFKAVRTVGANGRDATTVQMSFFVQTLWASTGPDNVLFSKNGRNIKFKDSGGGVLLSKSDIGNTTGGGFGNCGDASRAIERPFEIENSIFEATEAIEVEAVSELFLACK